MTLKEAKKILKKEGFIVGKIGKPRTICDFFIENEAPDICEAMQVFSTAGYDIYMEANRFEERKERLKKEYEENTKAPGSDENSIKGDLSGNESIEHCGEPIPGSPLSAVEGIKLKRKDNQNTSENPALKESASQFNDALLDEQAKEIKCIKEKNLRLGREIARLNKIIHKKNLKIEELKEESSERLDGKVKYYGETVDLTQELFYKNEELRLSKIRERNLTEVGQKYMKENEELRKKLADKVVDEINAKALKSAESALAYKEKVIAEKDEVIADLTHELKAKHKKYVWYKGAYDAAQQILNTIADYAAKHPDKKFSDQMIQDAHVRCGAKVLVDKSVFEQIMKKAYGK